jgi:AraC-like DNA-binding protein
MALVARSLASLIMSIESKSHLVLGGDKIEHENILPALSYIDEHLQYPITLKLLSDLCGMSIGHFSRTFKAEMGDTPNSYIKRRRISIARQRIVYTNKSIECIAKETGFSTREYFTRVFTEIVGLQPSLYRNLERAKL